MWKHVGTRKVEPPIPYTCRECYYPGQITRVCDVPSYCLSCGRGFSPAEHERLTKQLLAQEDRAGEQQLTAWRRENCKPVPTAAEHLGRIGR